MDQTLIIKYLYLENKEFIRKLIYHSYRQKYRLPEMGISQCRKTKSGNADFS